MENSAENKKTEAEETNLSDAETLKKDIEEFGTFAHLYSKDIHEAANYANQVFMKKVKKLFIQTYEFDPGEIQINISREAYHKCAQGIFFISARKLYEVRKSAVKEHPEIFN
jgi:hypothetical protein